MLEATSKAADAANDTAAGAAEEARRISFHVCGSLSEIAEQDADSTLEPRSDRAPDQPR